MKRILTIDQVLEDKNLLGMFMQGASWSAWRTLWRAARALRPKKGDLELFQRCTGRKEWPTKPATDIYIIVSRRGGKTINVAIFACYKAVFNEYDLAPGEWATIIIISPTKGQSKIAKGYISSFFHENPFLRKMILNETAVELSLTNRVQIQVMTSDFRSIRGFSSPLVILEEAAFFYQEGQKTDTEAIRAVKPSLATLGGTLCVISSPFAKSGAVYEAYSRYWGVEGDTLIWRAPSFEMNPLLNQEIIKKALEEDREAALSEWMGEFRSDISSFLSPEVIEACTIKGCHERGSLDGMTYFGFTDMAGGSGKDSATLAIAHSENGKAVLDCLRETRPPFSPEQCVEEFSNVLKKYRCQRVHGDKYAGDWPKERFLQHGISYEAESRSKSDLYIEALPLLNSGQVELLDHETLKRQLRVLERRTHAGGRQSVDHPVSGKDDVSNAACGAIVNSFEKRMGLFTNLNRAIWRFDNDRFQTAEEGFKN